MVDAQTTVKPPEPNRFDHPADTECEMLTGLSGARSSDTQTTGPGAERISFAYTDQHRQFMHIAFRSSYDDSPVVINGKPQKRMISCDTCDGPYSTKWSLHFYPEGHPSNYIHPEWVEWFPAQYIPENEKSASLYVRLKDGPHEMVEARMMTTVLGGECEVEEAVMTNMERFMLFPRMKVDEFHKDSAGHGWPKLCSTTNLKKHLNGFTCVVSLQVLQPANTASFGTTFWKQLFIPVHRFNHRNKKPHTMVAMQRHGEHCDAVLLSSDFQPVRTHRFLLATKSNLFHRKLRDDHGVPFVYQTNHSLEQLQILMDMLYLGRIPARTRLQSNALAELAAFYELPEIKNELAADDVKIKEVANAAALQVA